MPAPAKWVLILLLALILLCGIAGGVAVIYVASGAAKDMASQRVSQILGRELTIGALDVHLDDPCAPRITLHDVKLANAAWAEHPYLAEIGKLEFRWRWMSMLQDRERFPLIALTRPRLFLARSQQGKANWHLTTGGEPTVPPIIDDLRIDQARLTYSDHPRVAGPVTLKVAELQGTLRPQALRLEGSGTYRQAPFTIKAAATNPDTPDKPNRIRVDASLGSAKAHLDGALAQPGLVNPGSLKPGSLKDLDADINLRIKDPAALAALFDTDLCVLPAAELTGRLSKEGDSWQLTDLSASVGASELLGRMRYARGKQPAALRADLRAPKLDLVQLGILGAPDNKPGGPLIPEAALPVKLLNRWDVQIHFQGRRVYLSKLILDDVRILLALEAGDLQIHPASFDIAGGAVSANMDLLAGSEPIQSRLHLNIKQLNLRKILARFNVERAWAGEIRGQADLAAKGKRLPALVKTLDGDIALTMQHGRLDRLTVKKLSEDVPTLLATLAGKRHKAAKLRCVISDWQVHDGRFKAKRLLVDTVNTKVIGKGTIDLAGRSMDITLLPRDKDFSLLSAEAPIHIQGSLGSSDLSVDRSAMVASLATPIELGVSDDADCQGLAHAARKAP